MLERMPAPALQGYLDEISATHAIGWARDAAHPAARLAVALVDGAGQVLAEGVADAPYAALGDGFDARNYGFALPLPAGLEEAAREGLSVVAGGCTVQRAGALQGYVNQRSVLHIAGWVRDRFAPARRLMVEATLNGAVVASGLAERFELPLVQHAAGDARYGFLLTFDSPLLEDERDALVVRAEGVVLPPAPNLVTAFELLSHCAVDIVNNCNLRCPFCLFDYAHTRATKFMTPAVFESALRLLPLVPKGGFWLSCLHEPSLHPDFLDFIARVPLAYRDRLMFTTNIAKKANDAYFAALANSGAYHINISIESRTPAIYERFRKGAKFAIFQENWDRLIAAWRAAAAPPHLRYIIMGYRTNLEEIPSLVRYLREERLAWHVEVRYTYDEPHIADEFRDAEFLAPAQWEWLQAQLGGYPVEEVSVLTPSTIPREFKRAAVRPPAAVALPEPVAAPEVLRMVPTVPPWRGPLARPGSSPDQPTLPLNVQMRWDGSLSVSDKWDDSGENWTLAEANICGVVEPLAFLLGVAAGPRSLGYVDDVGEDFVAGWMFDDRHPDRRIAFEVVLRGPDGCELLGAGCADREYQVLRDLQFPATDLGFHVAFPRALTAAERDGVEIWPQGVAQPLIRAPRLQGYVNARSCTGVGGWVRDRFNPQARLAFEVFIARPGQVERLGQGVADQFSARLAKAKRGDAHYAFAFIFPRTLTPEERDAVVVRVIGERAPVPISPRIETS